MKVFAFFLFIVSLIPSSFSFTGIIGVVVEEKSHINANVTVLDTLQSGCRYDEGKKKVETYLKKDLKGFETPQVLSYCFNKPVNFKEIESLLFSKGQGILGHTNEDSELGTCNCR